jgi:hypothetical protein
MDSIKLGKGTACSRAGFAAFSSGNILGKGRRSFPQTIFLRVDVLISHPIKTNGGNAYPF